MAGREFGGGEATVMAAILRAFTAITVTPDAFSRFGCRRTMGSNFNG